MGFAVGDSSRWQSLEHACTGGQGATWVLALTIGHELHDEPWVGDIGAAHLSAAHMLTHLRHHACHFVWGKGQDTVRTGPGLGTWIPEVGAGNSNESEVGFLKGGGSG